MCLYSYIQNLKAQIVDTERLLEMVLDHPLMSESLTEKLNNLRNELQSLPKESHEPKVQLLFSGNAVIGSKGIKSKFISNTISPFQEMVKTQASIVRFGNVGKRGQTKKAANTDLYLTALPVGSFGVELSQLQSNDLFDSLDVSNAMKQVMTLISNTTVDDKTFETTIEQTPNRILSNLKKFFHEISEERSILKMECGELGFEIPLEKINEGYIRVSSTIVEEEEIIINGIFRGLLLDSGRFEIQDETGMKISGFIGEDINEEELIEYHRKYLNNQCKIYLKKRRTTFGTGKEKFEYELLEIRNNESNR